MEKIISTISTVEKNMPSMFLNFVEKLFQPHIVKRWSPKVIILYPFLRVFNED